MAQISEPLAAADIPAYYISTFKFDHALVSVGPPPQGRGGPVRWQSGYCSPAPALGFKAPYPAGFSPELLGSLDRKSVV